jgi:hypothetical protein
MSYHQVNSPGKTSSDSGHGAALDRFNQRRLQRLNTEQGFREQRQGTGGGQQQQQQQGGVLSPPGSLSGESGYNSNAYQAPEPQPQQLYQPPAQAQPHPVQAGSAYQSARTAPASHANNAGLAIQTQPVSSQSRGPNNTFTSQETLQQQNLQYSPPHESSSSYLSDDTTQSSRPALSSSRSYSASQQQSSGVEEASMSSSNNGSLPAPRAQRSGNSNRQSMHNGLNSSSREGSALGSNGGQQQPGPGVPAFNASVVPAASQGQPSQQGASSKGGDVGRVTPQPAQTGDEMSEEDVTHLIKEHKELRMYTHHTTPHCTLSMMAC